MSYSFATSSVLVTSSNGLQPNGDGLPLVASLLLVVSFVDHDAIIWPFMQDLEKILVEDVWSLFK